MRGLYISSISCLIMLYLSSCYKEEVIYDTQPDEYLEMPLLLQLNNKNCAFDFNSSTLRYAIPSDSLVNFTPFVSFQSFAQVSINNQSLVNDAYNNLGTIRLNEAYPVKIQVNGEIKQLSLTFTNLPIVQLISAHSILDEPKSLARIVVNQTVLNSQPTSSYIGLEYRGASSQSYPKKSFGFSFLNNAALNDRTSISLFGFKTNEDWILDAMYIDKSRLRNKVSFEIWNAMGGSKHYGIRSQLVELYLNNEHIGLYALNETINSESLDLCNAASLLYKATAWGNGTTTFDSLGGSPPNKDNWDGWEQKHPEPNNSIEWTPLFKLRDLVVHKDDATFMAQISNQIEIDNFIDYYLFLNLILAYDNSGKNTFLTRQDQQDPLAIIPWDLDGSWGVFWNGNPTSPQGIISNNLYDRLLQLDINNFKLKLKTKWFNLRNTTFSQSNLLALFNASFLQIKKADIISIENDQWNLAINPQTEQNKITSWMINRLSFLDNYYTNL